METGEWPNNAEKQALADWPSYEVSDDLERTANDTGSQPSLKDEKAQSEVNRNLVLFAAGASEQGGRFHNDDFFLVRGSNSALSDGINGADYGDLLSQLCCRAFLDDWETACNTASLTELCPLDKDHLGEQLVRSAFRLTDGFVSRVSSYLGRGSGATLLTATRWGDNLLVGSVGDTAAFILNEFGEMERVMEDDGRVKGSGNALSTAMGYHIINRDESRVQTAQVPLVAGRRIALCTDGVWTQLPQERMAEILAESGDPYVAASLLTGEAAKAGGQRSDNATAVVINVSAYSETGDTPEF